MKYTTPFLETWPEYSFESIKHIEIECTWARWFYRSFFRILDFPETVQNILLWYIAAIDALKKETHPRSMQVIDSKIKLLYD